MNEWKTLTLGELCTKITDGSHQSPKTVLNSGFPMSSVKDLYHYGIDLDSSRTISENDYQALVKQGCKPEVGDVLIAKDGNSALDTVCVINEPIETVLLSSVAILRPNPLEIVPEYLKYYLTAPKTIEYLKSNFISGAAIPRVVLRDFKLANITYPPLPEQKAIAHILGKLDDKIELNRRMNQTLEAMAQALFKSWFVDFDPVLDNTLAAGNDIPDELQAMAEKRTLVPNSKKLISKAPELAEGFPSSFVFNETLGKWIPEGWEDFEVGDILKRLKISNRYKKDQVNEFGKVPVYEQGADILLGYHENEPDVDASINHPAFIFGDHTCVMKLGISPFSISANVIVLKGNVRNTIWTYFGLQGVQSFEEYRRHWMELIVKSIILPPVELCDKFQELIKPSIQQKFETQKQIETLTQLRDTLLPELISGRVRVK